MLKNIQLSNLNILIMNKNSCLNIKKNNRFEIKFKKYDKI